jgi:hypothetical protein
MDESSSSSFSKWCDRNSKSSEVVCNSLKQFVKLVDDITVFEDIIYKSHSNIFDIFLEVVKEYPFIVNKNEEIIIGHLSDSGNHFEINQNIVDIYINENYDDKLQLLRKYYEDQCKKKVKENLQKTTNKYAQRTMLNYRKFIGILLMFHGYLVVIDDRDITNATVITNHYDNPDDLEHYKKMFIKLCANKKHNITKNNIAIYVGDLLPKNDNDNNLDESHELINTVVVSDPTSSSSESTSSSTSELSNNNSNNKRKHSGNYYFLF